MTNGDRTPPHDLDAERATLGGMMLSKDAVTDVVDVITGADYYDHRHEEIHDTIVDLFTTGAPTDPLAVADALTKTNRLAPVGGAEYLHTLMSATPTAANVAYYAGIIREKAVLRRIITAGTRIVQMGYAAEDDADAIADTAQAELFNAVPKRTAEDYRPIGAILPDTLDEVEALGARGDGFYGVPTGFYDLDDLLGGLHAGQMIVVAGRPASGKSTLAVDFMRAAAIHHGMTAVMFSLEMGRHELTSRILAAEAKVPLSRIRSGKLSDDDWGRIAGVVERVGSAPLFIDDSPNLNMTQIRAKARKLHHDTGGLRFVAIDYMQLMTSGKRVENRQVEVSEFSRQIKLLAKELDVPVVALSQLNRGPEQRTSKRPMLSDLRESGSIEQDADVVILVHRDDMYEAESSRPGEADLIVAKHRNGPTRDVIVAFQGHYARFVDMARL